MGFSLVAAAAIIGVAVLICVETVVETTIPTLTSIHDAYEDMRDRAVDRVQTDINITSAITSNNGSNYDLNVTVENTGSVTLETRYFDILINGTKHTFTCSKSYLYPEKYVYFNIVNLNGTGKKRLKVVTNNGVSDYYEYTIT